MSHKIGDIITFDKDIKLKIIDIDNESNSCYKGKYIVMGAYSHEEDSNIKMPFLARIPSLDIDTATAAAKNIDNAISLDKTMLKQIQKNQSKDIQKMIKDLNIKIGCHDLSSKSGGKKSRKIKDLKSKKRRTRRRRKLVKKNKKTKEKKKKKNRRTMKKRRRKN